MNQNYISMTGLSKYITTYGYDTLYNKTMDYNSNQFINFPFSSNLDSNIINQITALLSNFDSNNLIALSNLVSQININTSNNSSSILVLNNDITSLNTGISNNKNDIYGLSIYSSNFSLQSYVNDGFNSLNQGYSNNESAIQGLSILSSNYLTSNSTNTVINKTFDFNSNIFLNFNNSVSSSNITSILNISNPYRFKASSDTDQNLTANVWATIQTNIKEYDSANSYNVSTYTYTIKEAGYYYSDYCIIYLASSVVNNQVYQARLLINGTTQSSRSTMTSVKSGDEISLQKANVDYLNVGDTVELQGISSVNTTVRGYVGTHFNMHLLSVNTPLEEMKLYTIVNSSNQQTGHVPYWDGYSNQLNSNGYNYVGDFNSLNIGYSNNYSSIQGLSINSSNYANLYQINSLNEGYSNNYDSIQGLSLNSSNYAIQYQITSLNEGYSNNYDSIQGLSLNSSNYASQYQITYLNEGYSNNYDSIQGLSLNSSNYANLYQITSLNEGYSNNYNSIQGLSLNSSNYANLYQITSLNEGYSNNYNSIQGLSLNSSNYASQYQINSLNEGYSNNYSSISSLSIASSNYITISSTNTLINKTMDYNNNTFLNFPSSGGSNITMSNYPISIENIDNPYKFRAVSSNYLSYDVLNTYFSIPFESVDYDTNSNYNTSNNTWTCPINGYYDIRFNIAFNGVSCGGFRYELLKNDTDIIYTYRPVLFSLQGAETSYQQFTCEGGDIYKLNSGDTLKVRGYKNIDYLSLAQYPKFFTGHLLSLETPTSVPIITEAIYTGSNLFYTTSNNYYSTSNYDIFNYYSTSNYSTSNYSISNYFTSNNYTSNNYGTDIRNVFNGWWGRAFMDTTQSNLTTGTWYILPVNQFEYYGANNGYDLNTYTLTIQVAGVYRFSYGVEFQGGIINDLCHTRILKNGSEQELHKEQAIIKSGQIQDITLTDILELEIGDTLQLQAKVDSQTNTIDVLGNSYALGGADLTHYSWTLETATGVLTNSNLYLNTSATQTASNFTAFAGYSNSLIATNMWCQTSNVGINTSSPTVCLDLNCTSAIKLPKGTTAQRPSNQDGLFRYNTTSNIFEGCSNNTWGQIGGVSSGGIATALQTLTNTVLVSGSTAPIGGYVLTARDASNATWSNFAGNNGYAVNISNPYKARAYLSSSSTGITNSTWTKVNLNTENYDTNNNFDSTTNFRYNVPVTGYYLVNGNVTFSNVVANKSYIGVVFLSGGLATMNIKQCGDSTNLLSCPVSDLIYCTAGQYLELYGLQDTSSTTPVFYGEATGAYTYMSVILQSTAVPTGADYSLITAVSNPYKLRAFNNASSSGLTNNTWTKVGLNTESYDTNNNFTGSTYTVPVSGYYTVIATVMFRTTVADKTYAVAVYKNGSAISYSYNTTGTITGGDTHVLINDIVYLTAGNTIELYAQSQSGNNSVILYGDSSGQWSHFNVFFLYS